MDAPSSLCLPRSLREIPNCRAAISQTLELTFLGMKALQPSLAEVTGSRRKRARANVLMALLDGRAFTPAELAYYGGLPEAVTRR